jgi:hypothetical protein
MLDLEHLARKFNVSPQQIAGARRAAGHSRSRVEAYLRDRAKR